MEELKTTPREQWSDEKAIELIRKLRNDLIKDFLDERNLVAYFSQHYSWKELTTVKIEFIKKELKELLIAPVDLQHYHTLIAQIRETDTASISEKNESLFYSELEKVFRKYIF